MRAFELLKDESGTVTSGRRGSRLRRMGVLVQVTVSVVLLTAAGLLATALVRQQRLTPGFDTGGLGLSSFNLQSRNPRSSTQPDHRLLAAARVIQASPARTSPRRYRSGSIATAWALLCPDTSVRTAGASA